MKVGDHVEVRARWSQFYGRKGVVTGIEPCTWVLLEGERKPLRLDDCSLVRIETPEHVVAGE